ncbi:hypothetical protein M3Y94_00265100 [Aphelenchoides besseyi]|nr:hypothetical protein M3Y94_00265100 [Aphelenchoides besseyi]KAI6236136.1 hypothetical protein M3Y95_00125600 [Aphelenchoides besseyi]
MASQLSFEAKCALARFYVHEQNCELISEDRRKRLIRFAKLGRHFILPTRHLLKNTSIAADPVNPHDAFILTIQGNQRVLLKHQELRVLLELVVPQHLSLELKRFPFQPTVFEKLRDLLAKWISLPTPIDYKLPIDGINGLSIDGNKVDEEYGALLQDRASSLRQLECASEYLNSTPSLSPMKLDRLKLTFCDTFEDTMNNIAPHTIKHLDLSSERLDLTTIDQMPIVRNDLHEITLHSSFHRFDLLISNALKMKEIAPNFSRLNSTCHWNTTSESFDSLVIQIFERAHENVNQLLEKLDFVTLNLHCNACEREEGPTETVVTRVLNFNNNSRFFDDKSYTSNFDAMNSDHENGNYIDAQWLFTDPRFNINIYLTYQRC